MKISACLIVKDDSQLPKLKVSVSSFEDYVDEVHIVANGKDCKAIEKWCIDKGFDYKYLPWNKDFSQQRNYSFSLASKDTDYIYWQDYDDVLIGGDKLREVASLALKQELDCVYFTYWYSCKFTGEPSVETFDGVEIKQVRERLINPKKMFWKKRIHETPIELPGVRFQHSKYTYDEELRPVAVMHTGAFRGESREDSLARLERNREILELELEDERKAGKPDPRTILYLMKIFPELNDEKGFERCISLGDEYLKLSGWDEERSTCYILMGRCYNELGDVKKAYECYKLAIDEYPHNVLPYLRLAGACFDLQKFRDCEHWLNVALQMQEESGANIDNILENEILAAELAFKLNWYVKKNTSSSAKAIQKLYELNPAPENEATVKEVGKLANLDIACKHVDKLCEYLVAEGQEKAVLGVLKSLPQAITSLPFAVKLYQRHSRPKIWGANEICYYANFNGKHFEEWSPASLGKGIGGSETAVIELAKEWTKLGYRVTVYGDPGSQMGEHDGVLYLPYYYFNHRDKFNYFVQWRGSYMAKLVSAKKFYVDLHDVSHSNDHLDKLEAIDGIFVKSQYHRRLIKDIPDEKVIVLSNGIRIMK